MELQFTLDNQSLQTLCYHYVCNSKQHQKTVLLNSMLMALIQIPIQNVIYTIFDLSKNTVQAQATNINSKEYRKNMMQLLMEILKKYPKSLTNVNPSNIKQIVQYAIDKAFCAVSGNQCIIFITYILQNTQNSQQLLSLLESNLILNNKMTCLSYKQTVRNKLYCLLLKVLKVKKSQNFILSFISRIVQMIEDEKDPRNISIVFEIYHIILTKSSSVTLQPLKKKLFDCLEMYYPIEFEGDTERFNINLPAIKHQLDRCLSNILFKQQTFALLQIKMGAPPISKYVSLLEMSLTYTLAQKQKNFLANLLIRTTEQQYFFESYEQQSYTIANLITIILKLLCKDSSLIQYYTYEKLVNWLNSFIHNKIYDNQQNAKCAGIVIEILQKIGSQNLPVTILNLVAEYVVISFLKIIKNKDAKGDIIYKLGILVPIFQSNSDYIRKCAIMNDIEKIGFIIMSLSHIFHTTDNDIQQPKLVALKILLLLSELKDKQYHKLVNQTNINHHCLQFIKNPTISIQNRNKIVIIKSYIDFVIQFDVQRQGIIQTIMQKQDSIMCYGIINLLLKLLRNNNQKNKNNIWQILLKKANKRQLVNVMKSIKIGACLKLCKFFSFSSFDINILGELENTILQKLKSCKKIIEEEQIYDIITDYIVSDTSNLSLQFLYVTKRIWRSLLENNLVAKTLQSKLKYFSENIAKQELSYETYLRTVCFYNSSVKSNSQINLSESQLKNPKYIEQRYCLLPIDPQVHVLNVNLLNNLLNNSTKTLMPSVISYLWKSCNGLQSDKRSQLESILIPHLPNYYLRKEGNKILSVICKKEEGIQVLARGMVENLSLQALTQFVLPLLLKSLQNSTKQSSINRVLAINKVLFSLKTISESGDESKMSTKEGMAEELFRDNLRSQLIQKKGIILIAIQQKLLQHRKRLARQSSRHLFAVFNMMK